MNNELSLSGIKYCENLPNGLMSVIDNHILRHRNSINDDPERIHSDDPEIQKINRLVRFYYQALCYRNLPDVFKDQGFKPIEEGLPEDAEFYQVLKENSLVLSDEELREYE